MSLKSKANSVRRKLMHSLTHNIGKKSVGDMQKKAPNFKVNRVLISRPNHRLGNMLLITPLVQEIANTFPNCTIDLFVKGKITPIIFQNYPQVKNIIELPKKPLKDFSEYLKVWFSLKRTTYDLVINVEKGSSSGRISTIIPSADFKFYGDDFVHYLKSTYNPLNVVFRLANETSLVLLNGGGFAGPKWSVRVSLANLNEADYVKIGKSIKRVLDEYAKVWQS